MNEMEEFGMGVVAAAVGAVQTYEQSYSVLVALGPGNYVLVGTNYVPAAARCTFVAVPCTSAAARCTLVAARQPSVVASR